MGNRFAGTCRDCGDHVEPGAGNFHLTKRSERGARKFEIRCRACIDDCNASPLNYEDWRLGRRASLQQEQNPS
jgi:hypothetical protein